MISNPYLPMPSAALAWSEGFVKGFGGSEYSVEPPPNIAQEDVAAFSEGVLSGQQAAIDGLVFIEPCLNASETPDNLIDHAGHIIDFAHIGFGAWEIVHKAAYAAGLAGMAVGFVTLATTLPVHTLPPEQILPGLGQVIIDSLTAYGVESLELFCAGGLDATSQGCEIMVSPMYKSLEQAREAATSMGRQQWVIASWRTDASGSFRIVESS